MFTRTAALAAVLSAPAAAQVAVSFDVTDYPAGADPSTVDAADLDGDGAPGPGLRLRGPAGASSSA